MKKIVPFILIFAMVFVPTASAAEPETYYRWLDNNDMLVDSSNIDEITAATGFTGLTEGTVFLSAEIDGDIPANGFDMTGNAAIVGLTYVDFYNTTHQDNYLEKIILIADNTIANRTINAKFAYGTDQDLTLLCPNLKVRNGTWQCDYGYQEIYPADNLLSAAFLLDAYQLTNNEVYKDTALAIIDSWVFVQDYYRNVHDGRVAGALPFVLWRDDSVNNDPFRLTWTMPNDAAYAVNEAYTRAYALTGDEKYKTFGDDYFSYLYNILDTSSMFSFEKDGVTYRLPYEYTIVNDENQLVGANLSNWGEGYGADIDITTDQLFYTVLGIINYNKDHPLARELYQSVRAIMLPNGGFYGEYNTNGEKGSHDVSIELVNTGFYLDALTTYDAPMEEKALLINYLLGKQRRHSHPSVDGAWKWDGEDVDDADHFTIEGIATAIILSAMKPYLNSDGTYITSTPPDDNTPVDNSTPTDDTTPNNNATTEPDNSTPTDDTNPNDNTTTGPDTSTPTEIAPTTDEIAQEVAEEKVDNPNTVDNLPAYIITLASCTLALAGLEAKRHYKANR